MRVLVVEDDPQLGPWLRDAFAAAFGSSDMVTTLDEGRAAVAVRNFELVVIDRGLPDGDGLALLPETGSIAENTHDLVARWRWPKRLSGEAQRQNRG